MSQYTDFSAAVRQFAEERNWTRFHDTRGLTLALVNEVGELAEVVMWADDEWLSEAERDERRTRTVEELSDVFLYCVHLANHLEFDLFDGGAAKLEAARLKYAIGSTGGTRSRLGQPSGTTAGETSLSHKERQ
jgi:dCTP diphosphatase